MGNSLGKAFTITSFGESHGRCIGVVVDGCPAGLAVSKKDIQRDLDRRKPGTGEKKKKRVEEDRVEILSGIMDETATGAPICMAVWNTDVESREYERKRFMPRPGQADYTAFVKYGGFNDFRGGGRFSGRTTASLVMGGAVARRAIAYLGIEVMAHTVQIGTVRAKPVEFDRVREVVPNNSLGCADEEAHSRMVRAIEMAREEGDSLGGVIEGMALNVPAGLGEPVFDTLDGELARAIMAIPAVKGVEFGAGFSAAAMKGSENNDPFTIRDGKIVTTTNNSGGILGGISNGMPVVIRAVIKPTPSLGKRQTTVNMRDMTAGSLTVRGRHDACIVPRAVVVVESMMAVAICDLAIRAGMIPEVIR